ncbi:MAG: hypothetical protein A2289_11450 [Deltaproteobacteria bacterium RIFOXYA12_FULL_58_15]|nr:MAG: hypothetical protein A2289_11450 [Deltaproteobacteria bacterium RIFOXYA12_FULL_58_15]OGR13182.1 MAG: hypothetical protein A2341_15275 [Deltaproteobacteria bacterium RIFOXYB12_FULL_58_9]
MRVTIALLSLATACSDPFFTRLPEIAPPDDPGCAPDSEPQDLKAAVFGGRVDLSWRSSATNAEGYVIERRPADGGWTEIGQDSPPSLKFTDTTIVSDFAYAYRVKGFLGGCQTAPTSELEVFSLQNAITNFSATSLSDTTITLTWSEDNSLEAGFRLERKIGATGAFTLLDDALSPNTVAYSDTTATADNEHFYRLAVRSRGGDLTAAQATSAWTRPHAPTDLVASAVSQNQIDLDWIDTNQRETGYRVDRSINDIDFTTLVTLPADTTHHSDTNVDNQSWYFYRIYAQNVGGESIQYASGGNAPLLQPQLSWNGHPSLDGCNLDIPAVVDAYQEGALFSSATGVVERIVDGDVIADATGLRGVVDSPPTPGSFSTSWVVTDSRGSNATLSRTLYLGFAASEVLGTTLSPVATMGEDVMTGRQVYFPSAETMTSVGCSVCAGKRGSLTTGPQHACVLTSQGGVKCWGHRGGGRIGDGDPNPDGEGSYQLVPTDVCASGTGVTCVPLTGVSAVVAGPEATCALMDHGVVKCWGRAANGNFLGDGNSSGIRSHPVDVCEGDNPCVPISGVVAIDLGDSHGCALLDTGGVKCWGYNSVGAVGDGTRIDRPSAVGVCDSAPTPTGACECAEDVGCDFLTGVIGIAAGGGHSCALLGTGEVKCWGQNTAGAALGCGANATGISSTPNPVQVCESGSVLSSCVPLTGASDISAGASHTCIADGPATTTGRVKCWGEEEAFAPILAGPTPISNPISLCNNGAVGSSTSPCDFAVTGVVTVSAGPRHTCMLMHDGSIKCVGFIFLQQYPANPTTVCASENSSGSCTSGLTGFVSIDAGSEFGCALDYQGGVTCFGDNSAGQLGNGLVEATNPVDPGPLCRAGTGSTCADGERFLDAALRGCGDPLMIHAP